MAAFNKFNQFVENLCKGVHNFTSDTSCTVTVALTNTAPTAANAVLADITQIAYTNLSTRVLTGVTAEQSSGSCTITADDITLTASGAVGPFRYAVLYDDDPTGDPLIGWYDYGTSISLANTETFVIDFTVGFATIS
jgi:hypothetical protein